MAFLANYLPKRVQNHPFFAVFVYFGRLGNLFDFCDLLHHHPWTGRSPRQQSVHQAVLEPPTRSLALSKCRSGASDYGWGMMQSLPLSYWSPEKSYMTSRRTATLIYIAARFRVKHFQMYTNSPRHKSFIRFSFKILSFCAEAKLYTIENPELRVTVRRGIQLPRSGPGSRGAGRTSRGTMTTSTRRLWRASTTRRSLSPLYW